MAPAGLGTGYLYTVPVLAQSQEDGITFPDVYSRDLVVPEDDETVVSEKVEALIRTMTREEKFKFMGSNGTGSEGNAGALEGWARLGVPKIKMYDGPAGLLYTEDTTNPPIEQMLAATWSEEMAELYGQVYSKENQAMGGSMMLSAQLDIQRQPQFQRTKDQMGEDSTLLAALADDLVEGMTSEGGIAVLKHYGAFAQNANPGSNTNVEVSEQALMENYLTGFESAVRTEAAMGVMSSYNKYNGTWASASDYLQTEVLETLWGYNQFTITDWGGNHEFTLDKGTDIEMPNLSNNSMSSIDKMIEEGTLTRAEADELVDNALRSILTAYGKGGYLTLVEVDENGYAKEEAGRSAEIQTGDDVEYLESLHESSDAVVQQVAEEGGVLLKNQNETLPLNTEDDNTVAVIGLNGMHLIPGIGGERSYGTIASMTSPYEALVDLLGKDKVTGAVYDDPIGEVIPAENLYTSQDGEEHGAIRTYGTRASAESGSSYQGQFHGNSVPEKAMEGHEIGEYCTTDEQIDFNTGHKDYTNSENGTAFAASDNPAYTWDTWVEADETGDYEIIFGSMGAKAAFTIYEVQGDGTEKSIGSGSGATMSQGTQYYSGSVCSASGQNLSTATVHLEAGTRYHVEIKSENVQEITYKDMQVTLSWVTPSMKEADLEEARMAAAENDTVVIFAYTQVSDPGNSREETTLKMSDEQQNMILEMAAIAKENGNKVAVVLNNDSAVVMEDWIDDVDAILEMYYPGQKGGEATANLLTGEVNPSGKLAFSIPKKDTDTIITISDEAWDRFEKENDGPEEDTNTDLGGGMPFPGFGGGKGSTTYFDEGINTGWKWFEENNIDPQFEFGFGLSYTKFEYSDLEITRANSEGEKAGYDVTFTITNTGDVAGSETAQIYLGAFDAPEGIQTSKHTLAAFQKVKDIQPGESREVTIHVGERALSYWNSNQDDYNVNEDGTMDKWTVAEGERTIHVAASSKDYRLESVIDVEESDVDLHQKALSRMIALVESLDGREFTADSWQAVQTALAEAKAALADKNADTETLTAALTALTEAYGALEARPNTVHLETAIEQANKILKDAHRYQNDAVTLKNAVIRGEELLAKDVYTQDEADQAAMDILNALIELVVDADMDALESLVKSAEKLLDGNFTASSLENLRNAIEQAKAVLDGINTDTDAVSGAYTALLDAMASLQTTANRDALKAVLDKADAVLADGGKYAAATLEGLQAAVENGKAVYNSATATQAQIDAQTRMITRCLADVRRKGDINNDERVDTSDAALLLRASAELETLDDAAAAAADVNEDGAADTEDAARILEFAAELTDSL